MDFSQVPDVQLDAELSGGQDVAVIEYIETRLRDLHTSMPGVVVSFSAAKQTAVVQPAIKRIFVVRNPGGTPTISQVNLPLCVDVPVKFPGGGGFFLTFPVQAGDECILHFSERAIDFWFQNGGQQLPSEYRLHDFSDAIADVGLTSQPNVLADFNASACQLRTRDGSTFLQIAAGTITIQGNLVVTGGITATEDVVGEGISLRSHVHSGVTTGSGDSGEPV
jgi:hypothetical protein